jgi:hypothetical protein
MAPLPFKQDRERLPNNRKLALDRALSFDQNLIRNPLKLENLEKCMQGLFDSEHRTSTGVESIRRMLVSTTIWDLPSPRKKTVSGVYLTIQLLIDQRFFAIHMWLMVEMANCQKHELSFDN